MDTLIIIVAILAALIFIQLLIVLQRLKTLKKSIDQILKKVEHPSLKKGDLPENDDSGEQNP